MVQENMNFAYIHAKPNKYFIFVSTASESRKHTKIKVICYENFYVVYFHA